MTQIKKIVAREILDSRGLPTVEAEVILTTGQIGRASVPSGASTGSREALELRDKDDKRYYYKGVRQAVGFIAEHLSPALIGCNILQQEEIDHRLLQQDGTLNKSKIGANALLAVSLAAVKAASLFNEEPLFYTLRHAYHQHTHTVAQNQTYLLPVPLMNIINGGMHADNNLDFQEFMIMPVGAPTFSESLRAGAEIFYTLKQLLKNKHYQTNVGDEGGFAPDLPNQEAALDLIAEAIIKAGYRLEKDICLALDVASSGFYQGNHYHLKDQKEPLDAASLVDYYEKLVTHYPIISIEDGMAEDDWEGWQLLTTRLGDRIQLVGDDLFVTNVELLSQGIEKQIANAILIKPNQIGTLSETFSAIQLAKKMNYNTIISHRSGETEDTSIADLAVATDAGQIKTGSLCRTDRVAKYNQLLRIEEFLAKRGRYAAFEIFFKKNKLSTVL